MPEQGTIPNLGPLSAKDLHYAHDIMSWELLMAKKYHHYEHEIMDAEAKQLCQKLAGQHRRHYELVLGHLAAGGAAGSGTTQ